MVIRRSIHLLVLIGAVFCDTSAVLTESGRLLDQFQDFLGIHPADASYGHEAQFRSQEDQEVLACSQDGIFNMGPCSSTFLACSGGIPRVMDCPQPLIFDPALNVCNWEHDVSGCPVNNQTKNRCFDVNDGMYSYGNCSESFYACSGGREVAMFCPANLSFDETRQRCEWPSDIAECQTDEGSGSGDDEGSGSGDKDGSGSGDEDGSGSGDEEGSGSGDEEGSGSGDEEGSGSGDEEGSGSGDNVTDVTDVEASGTEFFESSTLLGSGDKEGSGSGDLDGRGSGDEEGSGSGDAIVDTTDVEASGSELLESSGHLGSGNGEGSGSGEGSGDPQDNNERLNDQLLPNTGATPMVPSYCAKHGDGFHSLGCSSTLISCRRGSVRQLFCPTATVWDEKLSVCNYREDVDECRGSLESDSSESEALPNMSKTDVCINDGTFPESSCTSEFLLCTGGLGYRLSCDAGLLFSNSMEKCVPASELLECEQGSNN